MYIYSLNPYRIGGNVFSALASNVDDVPASIRLIGCIALFYNELDDSLYRWLHYS